MKALALAALALSSAAFAAAPADGGTPAAAPAAVAAPVPSPDAGTAAAEPAKSEPAPVPNFTPPPEMSADDFFVEEESGCSRWRHQGLMEGPIAIGYGDADMATGRRTCPRTEIGLGGTFGARLDTADFYGGLDLNTVVFASLAFTDKIELSVLLEPIVFQYLQNASLKGTQLVFGNLTAGGTYLLYEHDRTIGAVSARLLFPTSFAYSGARLVGIDVSYNFSWRAKDWLEVHSWLGADFVAGLNGAETFPRVGATLSVGAQLSPFDWGALVVDLDGRLGMDHSYLAPKVALRFRIARLGIELGATLPLVGNDRHDFIAGLKVAYRL
jgi:hypothetical protein